MALHACRRSARMAVFAVVAACLTAGARPDTAWQPIPAAGILSQPGSYRLADDMLVERSRGIEVQADDVTVDLGGHALRFAGPPRPGTYGIVANGRANLKVGGGVVGGFWYGIHASDSRGLRVEAVHFDDIPYIAINASAAQDMAISDNAFTGFRYDIEKDPRDHYVIAINTGTERAIICNNRFDAQVKGTTDDPPAVETVFVLLSADVTRDCVVAHNTMRATTVLSRGYGIWIATGAQALVANNTITNMQYAVCLGRAATAVVCRNRLSVDSAAGPTVPETCGVSATGATRCREFDNQFIGFSIPVNAPQTPGTDHGGAD